MQNEMEYYIETRLQEWANWYIRGSDGGLGYPRRSIEGKLIDNGGCIIRNYQSYRMDINPSAEETEKLLAEMSQYNKSLSKAVKYEYMETGTQSFKASKLGVSLAQFKLNLKIAKAWLVGRLSQHIVNHSHL